MFCLFGMRKKKTFGFLFFLESFLFCFFLDLPSWVLICMYECIFLLGPDIRPVWPDLNRAFIHLSVCIAYILLFFSLFDITEKKMITNKQQVENERIGPFTRLTLPALCLPSKSLHHNNFSTHVFIYFLLTFFDVWLAVHFG